MEGRAPVPGAAGERQRTRASRAHAPAAARAHAAAPRLPSHARRSAARAHFGTHTCLLFVNVV